MVIQIKLKIKCQTSNLRPLQKREVEQLHADDIVQESEDHVGQEGEHATEHVSMQLMKMTQSHMTLRSCSDNSCLLHVCPEMCPTTVTLHVTCVQ